MKIEDEALRRAIKHKALKSGTQIDRQHYLVKYNKVWYLLDFKDNNVITQSEYK